MFFHYSHHYPWTAVVFQNKAALTQISALMPVICELRFSVVPLHLPPAQGKRFKITCHPEGFILLTFTGQVSMFTSDEQISPPSLGSGPWDKGGGGARFGPKIGGASAPGALPWIRHLSWEVLRTAISR